MIYIHCLLYQEHMHTCLFTWPFPNDVRWTWRGLQLLLQLFFSAQNMCKEWSLESPKLPVSLVLLLVLLWADCLSSTQGFCVKTWNTPSSQRQPCHGHDSQHSGVDEKIPWSSWHARLILCDTAVWLAARKTAWMSWNTAVNTRSK